MSLRILVGMDGSNFGERAVAFALAMAKNCGATLAGMGVIDTFGIERHSAGANIGAFYFAEKLVDEKVNESRTVFENLLDRFEEQCKDRGVKSEKIIRYGTPAKEIIRESELADLLVLGIRTYFHFETTEEPDDTFEKVISHGRCPLIAVTDEELPTEMDVLMAYDGNLKSNNALKAFAGVNDRLNFSREVTLLNVNHDLGEGDRILEKAACYLQAHGLTIKKKVRAGRPREIIYKTAKEMEAIRKTLLVIGTSGSNELSDYILGNSIKNMVRDGSIPMFIFH
ncbi:Nucleotide-binding universal stress protein, UspA family [Syntrophus gentianae]|uniref:Nucleotide-binding universal stress protein, UspA family n=1 Tax=Syntrophus gentianae TaxID=43775 RepID=A0A1H8BFZ7_9BACT|nr:universal stress protein [Syntrophus gentianae]SEM81686.1 Nucleotide-binding universal stress protein, UspA family [Syntrophus gentianae]